jgi:hypothetical protein
VRRIPYTPMPCMFFTVEKQHLSFDMPTYLQTLAIQKGDILG